MWRIFDGGFSKQQILMAFSECLSKTRGLVPIFIAWTKTPNESNLEEEGLFLLMIGGHCH